MASNRRSMRDRSWSRCVCRTIGRAVARSTRGVPSRLVKCCETLACRTMDFQRADDPLRIRDLQLGCGFGVAREQHGVQLRGGMILCPASHLRTHGIGHGRYVRKPARERLQIEAGATDDDRQASCRSHVGENRGHIAEPAAYGVRGRAIHGAVKPMRHACFVGFARPSREHAQVAIDLHGIGIDDRAAPRRLARRSASADLPLAVGPAMRTTPIRRLS